MDKEVPLLEYIASQLEKAVKIAGHTPVPVVIGGKGRVGSGAVIFAKKLGLQPAVLGREDTKKATEKGLAQLLDYEILVNAVKLGDAKVNPFLTQELITREERDLTVIVDIR